MSIQLDLEPLITETSQFHSSFLREWQFGNRLFVALVRVTQAPVPQQQWFSLLFSCLKRESYP